MSEGDNKPIEGNGGAFFFVIKKDRMAELTMGITILRVAGTGRYIWG